MPLNNHFGFPKETFIEQFLKEAFFYFCKEHIYDQKNLFPKNIW